MITLRQMAVAFLFHGDQWLAMEKPQNNRFMSGMIVPIGGYLEQGELNNPKEACIREVEEETGLRHDDLSGLELKYVVLRIKETEIRIQYVYFANVNRIDIKESEEGRLLWIDRTTVDQLNITATTKYIFRHYAENWNSTDIYVGTMKSVGNEPAITWALLQDWENARFGIS